MGSTCRRSQKGAGVGLVLTSSEMVIVEKSLRLDFPATNNEAEYEALLEGMAMVQKDGREIYKTLLRLKAGCRSSEKEIRSQG